MSARAAAVFPLAMRNASEAKTTGGVPLGQPSSQGDTTISGDQILVFSCPSDAILAALEVLKKSASARCFITGEELSGPPESLEPLESLALIDRLSKAMDVLQDGHLGVSIGAYDIARSHLGDDFTVGELGNQLLGHGVRTEKMLLIQHKDLPAVRKIGGQQPPFVRSTCFFGRGGEIDALRQSLLNAAVVTITGPAGIGKSALARRLLMDVDELYPDGIYWIDAVHVPSPQILVSHVCRCVEALDRSEPRHLDRLTGFFKNRDALLVLDGCDRMLEEWADLAASLISADLKLQILATVRRPMSIAGESDFAIQGLEVPVPDATFEEITWADSVNLFVDCSQLRYADFTIERHNAQDVAALCRLLRGNPLAIEVAANLTPLESPHQIVSRLGKGDRTRAMEYLGANLALSALYAGLPGNAQTLLRRLSICEGTFTCELAERLCCFDDRLWPNEVFAALRELLAAGLVTSVRAETIERHFLISEAVRDFAVLELQKEEGRARCLSNANEVFKEFLGVEVQRFGGAENELALERLDGSYSDVRRVLLERLEDRRTVPSAVSDLIALGPYISSRDQQSEALFLVETALHAKGAESAPDYQRLVNACAFLNAQLDNLGRALLCVRLGLRLAREGGADADLARIALTASIVSLKSDHLATALRFARAALAAAQRSGKVDMGHYWMNLSALADKAGNFDEAEDAFKHIKVLVDDNPNSPIAPQAIQNLAYHYYLLGKYDRAWAALQKAIEISPRIIPYADGLTMLSTVVELLDAQQRHAEAVELAEICLSEIGPRKGLFNPHLIRSMQSIVGDSAPVDVILQDFGEFDPSSNEAWQALFRSLTRGHASERPGR